MGKSKHASLPSENFVSSSKKKKLKFICHDAHDLRQVSFAQAALPKHFDAKNFSFQSRAEKSSSIDSVSAKVHVGPQKLPYSGVAENFVAADFLKHFLIVQKKDSGKLCLVDINNSQIILRPDFIEEDRSFEDRGVAYTRQEVLEKNLELQETFGNAKSQRIAASLRRSNLDQQTVKEAMAEVIQEINPDEFAAKRPVGTLETQGPVSLLPPLNLDGSSASAVFPLDNIVPVNVQNNLGAIVDSFGNASADVIENWAAGKSQYPEFVISRLKPLLLEHNSTSKTKSITLLGVMSLFVYFYTSRHTSLRADPFPSCGYSPETKAWFTDVFLTSRTENRLTGGTSKTVTRFSMSSAAKSKLLSHIILLGMYIDSFHFSAKSVMTMLKISAPNLQTHVRAIGFKAGVKDFATSVISVPIPFVLPHSLTEQTFSGKTARRSRGTKK